MLGRHYVSLGLGGWWRCLKVEEVVGMGGGFGSRM